ncbi:unnamed protein product [Protopolystoma xenopodis]|uniref:Uncharacterized protein n=1 Tax=Protopolystoma xenopodis TaxID=117903 RepID=A0A3S5BMH9_9PLAT|nr:unnamed protein product [Protopolystoma xenopodis]
MALRPPIITTKQLQLNQQDESAAQERELLLADRTRLEDQLRKAQTNLALAALELRRITSSSAHSVVDSISSTAPARASVNHLDTDSVWLCQLDGVTCTSRHTKPNEVII